MYSFCILWKKKICIRHPYWHHACKENNIPPQILFMWVFTSFLISVIYIYSLYIIINVKIFEAVLICKFFSRNHERSKNQNDFNFYSNLTNLACFGLSCKAQAYHFYLIFWRETKVKSWNTNFEKVTGQTLICNVSMSCTLLILLFVLNIILATYCDNVA